ncbi:GNAT family N-acetyltransferase [Massilia horti]|uniref:GNAT family N-acetyltransferase n=1 Tax=Massilia horti TaxID=2562153 RepID=A0A4Y9T2Z1_9BURK|nr:GNAT family N-acetyltransferase [Massilia horti]TFW31876.1 GNAT family N-acetyltransferase [Massilia horti]
MLIRPIEQDDIASAAALLRELALEFIVCGTSQESASDFLRENDEEGVRGYIERGWVYHVALIDGELAGFVGMRERSHLFHLFVGKRWQRRGVARRLWDVARQASLASGHTGGFTVNASLYALPVYKALGFVPTAPEQCVRGIRFIPMALAAA